MTGDISPEGVPKDPPSLWTEAMHEMAKGNESLGREIALASIIDLLLQNNHGLAEKYIATSANRIIGNLLYYEPPPIRKDFVPNIVKVDLGNGIIGFKMEEDYSKLPLIMLFSPEAGKSREGDSFLREHVPDSIFFKTVSGNIYILNANGELQNKRDLRDNKPSTILDKSILENSILAIGERFFYLDPQRRTVATSKVKEIIAVNTKPYSKEAVGIITQGRTDNIMQEFGQNNPPPSNPSVSNAA